MQLHEFLDYRAVGQGDFEFAVMGKRSLTYKEAQTETHRIASAFVASGIEPGDRVAVLSKNSIEMALIYYAASRVGAVPVPLNYRLAAPEWAYIINDSGASLLLVAADLVAALAPSLDELSAVRDRVVINPDGAAPQGWQAWDDWLKAGESSLSQRDLASTDPVYQMYTSGTTGRPKGAVISHGALSGQLHQSTLSFNFSPGERTLIVAPLYHAAAALTTFSTVQAGGTLFIQEDFDPVEVVRALSEEDIVAAMLVPAMIQFCLVAVPDIRERNYDKLGLIIYGASPIAEQVLRDAIDVFDCDFIQGYGMTETTAVVCYLMPDIHRRALAGEPHLLLAAGRAVLGTDVRIVDEDDNPVPNGTIGEICGRGPQLMTGYWNLPEATEAALKGGWMHTGDAGIMDDEGFLFIQDRVKDMIVSGGENVYPREIEDVLYQFPGVAEAAVIGVPSEQWGEEVKAVIVRKADADFSAAEILAFCKGKLGGYKCPRSVDFIDAIPRNPSGKVLKKDLREPYWQGHGRRVS
jgi:acyl-CoA synthetase (AMP-forming)/AMP-acid ligase II